MNYKPKVKRSASSLKTILMAAVVGIAVQLIVGAGVALLVEQGSIAESAMFVAAAGIRVMSVIATTLTAWWTSSDKKITDIAVAAGIIMLLPLIVSLLFWTIDVSAFAIGFVASLAVFGVCLWFLNRPKKGRVWRSVQKRNR